MTSTEDGSPSPDSAAPDGGSGSAAPDGTSGNSPHHVGQPVQSSTTDAPVTTQLPAAGWTSSPDPGAGTEPGSGSGSGSGDYGPPADAASTPPGWSSQQTQNFPAYQPQSYPTYPPTQSSTAALPAVDAGGPPPSSAAAYSGTASTASGAGSIGSGAGLTGNGAGLTGNGAGAAAYGGTAFDSGKPVRRGGAGFAGAVGLIGLAAAVAGAFALPVQQFTGSQNTYFGTYRDLAARKLASSAANDHSISIVGGHIATDWWRYGVFGALGGLAFLFLIEICVPVLRRVAGFLLFLGGLAAAAGFLLGAHQTNDYSSVSRGTNLHRISWQHLAYGFWVAVAGCAVIAVAGLIAGLQSTRR